MLVLVLLKNHFYFNQFFLVKKTCFYNKTVFYVLFFYINEIYGYGNFFKLFYNTDLTSIKFIITIGYLYDELKIKTKIIVRTSSIKI